MSAFKRWRRLAFAGAVLLIAWATGSSGKQLPALAPTTPQQPPAIPQIPGVKPVAAKPAVDLSVVPHVTPVQPALPAIPAVPVRPAGVPVSQIPVVVKESPLEITEPVVNVHRFAGRYLGDDGRRVLVYVETGDGKAEVQSRPLTPAIPDADANTADDVKRLAVPVAKVSHHDGRAFLVTPREVLVIGTNCEVEWRFTLPGKPDNGETLIDVAGFHGGQVYLASQQQSRGGAEKSRGRIYTLDAADGRQLAFGTVEGGFEPQTQFCSSREIIYAVGGNNVVRYAAATGRVEWGRHAEMPSFPAAAPDGVFIGCAMGLGVAYVDGYNELLPNCSSTAPATAFLIDAKIQNQGVLVPARKTVGTHYFLSLFDYHQIPRNVAQRWQLPLKQPVTAAPVVRGGSVYFVAGNVLYRVNAATGAICWKQTLALNPGEAITELFFAGEELRGVGPGVAVQVTERQAPPAPAPGGIPIPVAPGF